MQVAFYTAPFALETFMTKAMLFELFKWEKITLAEWIHINHDFKARTYV